MKLKSPCGICFSKFLLKSVMAQHFSPGIVSGSPRQDVESPRLSTPTANSPAGSNVSTPATPCTPSFRLLSQAGNHEGIADMKGNLEEHFDMADWEFVGPQGSYAESVFKGKTWETQEEVAIKVVSLQNAALQNCKWVLPFARAA
jgi:hypothetical protein